MQLLSQQVHVDESLGRSDFQMIVCSVNEFLTGVIIEWLCVKRTSGSVAGAIIGKKNYAPLSMQQC